MRSPTLGARPGSRFLMRAASSTCACLLPAAYWSLVRVSVFEMTSFAMSISFISSCEIWPLTYCTAVSGALWMRIARSDVSTTSLTRPQKSRRTVSMPLQSIFLYAFVSSHSSPAYRFLFISRYG